MRRSRRFHRPWIYPPLTDDRYDRWLARQATDEFEGFLIVRRSDGELVGVCNLSQIIRGNLQGAFIGFGAVAGFEGRGYMRAGVGMVLDQAFGRLRLHRVEANVQPANRASVALVDALGFVREGFSERYLKVGGRWRDHERWAIRSELWRR
jgi:[ribosomal protein S5]-alanine N-acetyltransferase